MLLLKLILGAPKTLVGGQRAARDRYCPGGRGSAFPSVRVFIKLLLPRKGCIHS